MNKIERYGLRKNDLPSLHPLIPVLGIREVNELIKDAIPPHSMPFYQLLYVDQGELEWCIDGRTYHLSQGDFILIKPHETQNSLSGHIPTGLRYFMQLNLYSYDGDSGFTSTEREIINQLFQQFIPRTLKLGEKFKVIFLRLIKAHRERNSFSTIQVKQCFMEICSLLYEQQKIYLEQVKIDHNDAFSILQRTDIYIENHLDKIIQISELAKLFSLSEVHFRRKFLAASGLSPLKYINQKKLQEARRLLKESNDSMGQISEQLAYSSSQHFSSSFSKHFSMSPREYRSALKNLEKQAPLQRASEVSEQIDSCFEKK